MSIVEKQQKRKSKWEKKFYTELSAEYELITPIAGDSHSRVRVQHIPCGYIRDTETRRLFTQGCPVCLRSSAVEDRVAKYLDNRGITYRREVCIEDCKRVRPLWLDFVLLDSFGKIKCGIEVQGKQHYKRGISWGGSREMKAQEERDEIKRHYCLANNIILLEIKYKDDVEQKLDDFFR